MKAHNKKLLADDMGWRRKHPRKNIYRRTRVYMRDPEELRQYCRDFNHWMAVMEYHPKEMPSMPFIVHDRECQRDTLDLWWRMKRVEDLWLRRHQDKGVVVTKDGACGWLGDEGSLEL